METKETCYDCGGSGLIHSHNPICGTCGGSGTTTPEKNKRAKELTERMSRGYVHRGSYE